MTNPNWMYCLKSGFYQLIIYRKYHGLIFGMKFILGIGLTGIFRNNAKYYFPSRPYFLRNMVQKKRKTCINLLYYSFKFSQSVSE